MTLALKYGPEDINSEDPIEQGFIYFDSIQAYSKTIRGQVTKHSVAGGKLITDNFTRDNPTFGFTGVISVADLANNTLIRDVSGNIPNNFNEQMSEVIVIENTSKLRNFLPSSISQFLPDQTPQVSMAGTVLRNDYKDFVTQVLERLMSGEKYDQVSGKIKTYIRPVKLYEFLGAALTKVIPDLVLTSVDIREDVDTGDCLIVTLEFEQVRFVKLRTSAIPSDVASALKNMSAAKSNKGNVTSAPKQMNSDGDLNDDLKNAANVKERTAATLKEKQQ